MKKANSILLIAAIMAIAFYACHKEATEQSKSADEAQTENIFFAGTDVSDTIVKEFSGEIKKQSRQYHFLKYFIDNNGYPDWQKARVAASSSRTLAIIPFSLAASEETNGFVVCRKDESNHFSFILYKKDALSGYSFNSTDSDSLTAEGAKTFLDYFNYARFGTSVSGFITDSLLINNKAKNELAAYNIQKLMGKRKFTNGDDNNNASVNNLKSLSSTPTIPVMTVTNCITITEETDWFYNPDGDDCNCNGDEYYVYTTYTRQIVCTDGGGSGNGSNGNGGSGWWNGGGGGGNSTPPKPPVKDSNYYKDLLHLYTSRIGNKEDSVFNLAQTKKVEYSYIITEKGDSIYQRNVKTDNIKDEVTMNYRLNNGEVLKGEGHTHQDDIPNGPPDKRCALDMGDVFALSAHNNHTIQDFVSIVEIGDIRQALVIENPVKAAAFINSLRNKNVMKLWASAVMSSPLIYTKFRQAGTNVTLLQLGNSASTGIGLFQSSDAAKTQFFKLN